MNQQVQQLVNLKHRGGSAFVVRTVVQLVVLWTACFALQMT